MNDLTGFWEDDQSFSHSKHHVHKTLGVLQSKSPSVEKEPGEEASKKLSFLKTPGVLPASPARLAEALAKRAGGQSKSPGVGKDEALKAETPMVEKTRRQLPGLPALPAGPKRVLLAAAVLLVFGVLLGTNLPRRDSGEKLLLDIKDDIGEEAKLAGTALDATDAAVLGTAETTEGKIKVVSANLVGIWQTSNSSTPGVKSSPTIGLSPTPEVKSDALHEMESVALNTEAGEEEATPNQSADASGTGQASAAFPAEDKSEESPAGGEPELRLAGVRIMGEIQNVGGSTVYAANVFVRFYDSSTPGDSLRETPGVKSSAPVASKVGEWNQGYKFLPLAPDQTGVYDIVVLSPPEFENVTIEVKVDPTVKKSSFVTESLKVKSKTLEPTTMQQGNQQLNYFTFNGSLVNKDQSEIVNPSIYVWLKNREGKVIGLAAKTLASDLLLPGQELSVSLFVIPVTSDEMSSYEVRTFGNKL